jgi:hypothetical protein
MKLTTELGTARRQEGMGEASSRSSASRQHPCGKSEREQCKQYDVH